MKFEEFLLQCGGIERRDAGWGDHSVPMLGKVGDIVIPDNIYVEVKGTIIKGTIGKIIGFEPLLWLADKSMPDFQQIGFYNSTFIIEIDGRPKPSRIKARHTYIMDDYTGSTIWVRTKSKKRNMIPAHQNKYKQVLEKGTHVIGFTRKKFLVIGKVSRWTAAGIWIKTIGGSEHALYSYNECIIVDENELNKTLAFAKLSGWTG